MAMKFPQYVSTNERTVSVVGMIDKEKEEENKNIYQDGKGYIDEDQSIWIYCSGEPKNKNQYPYFWINDENKKEFSDPPEIIRKAFSVENMTDMSLLTIIDKTEPGEKLFDEDELNDMNAAAAFYVPIINENDDFLKKIVKTTIIQKGIDINRLKGRTDEKYILPNMKAALQNKTKMSVIYFMCWMNLLNCDFEITISDNGDKNDPLKKPIVYQSYHDNISEIGPNNELTEINIQQYTKHEEDEENE